MNLSTLTKTATKPSRRLGRGHGSGRSKTSGRGTKGQKARESVKLKFAGSSLQASWLKRLPLTRGKGKNKSHQNKVEIINVKYLNLLKVNSDVTLETLKKSGILGKEATRVKILGDGEVSVALNVLVDCSAGAKKKIEKAGGKVVEKLSVTKN